MAEQTGSGKGGGKKPSAGKSSSKNPLYDNDQLLQAAEVFTALRKITQNLGKDIEKLGIQSGQSMQLASKAAELFSDRLEKLDETVGSGLKNLKGLYGSMKDIDKSVTSAGKGFEKLTSSINKSLLVGEGFEKLNSSLLQNKEQINSINESSSNSSQGISQLQSSFKNLAKAEEKASKEAGFEKGGDGKNNIFKQMDKSSKAAKLGVISLAGAFSLLGKGIKAITSIGRTVFGIIGSVLGMIKSFIGGIIGFIGDTFSALAEQSNTMKDRMFEQAVALEKVKETFGDTSKGAGKAMRDFTATAVGMYSPTALRQIFGSAAEAGDYALNLLNAGAESSILLRDQIKENAKEIIVFSKAIGQTADEFEAMKLNALASGQSIADMQKDIIKYSQGFAKRLGLDAKLLAKNVSIAQKDVKHFANATIKQMTQAAAYANKLGLSLEKITGIMDAFDTFETAANNVSKLSQAFGVNLDTMKLLEANTPDEMLAQIKDAFNAAGKSAANMNRHELSLIASMVHLDEASVKAALSAENQGASLEDIEDAGSMMEKQMLSTSQAMKTSMDEIAMSLKKLERNSTGFFDAFLDGLAEGVIESGPMKGVLVNIAQALDTVFLMGRKLGDIIVNTFPGIKDMLAGLAGFFDPKKIGDMFGGFNRVFEKFFKNLQNGTGNVKDLFGDLFNEIKSYFSSQGSNGQKFLSGASDFWNAIKQIIATAILGIGELIAGMFSSIADVLDVDVKSKVGKAVENIQKSPIAQAFSKAFGKIKEQLDRIWAELEKRFESFLEKLKEKIAAWWDQLDIIDIMKKNPKASILLTLFGLGKLGALGPLLDVGLTIGKTLARGIATGIEVIGPKIVEIASSVGAKFAEIGSRAGASLVEKFGPLASKAAESITTTFGGFGSKASEAFTRTFGPAMSRAGAAFSNFSGAIGRGASAIAGAAGPILAVAAAAAAVAAAVDQALKLAKELKQYEEDRRQAQKDIEESAKKYGTAALRSKLGVTKEGKVDLSEDELQSMYKQHFGTYGIWEEKDKKKIIDLLEKDYKDNLKFAKEADERLAQEAKLGKSGMEAKKMMEESMNELGLTTIDNVEERIKKIQEIGAKVAGGKEEFNKNMETLRKNLSEMNFSLFDKPEDRDKFAKMLGDSTALLTFTGTMDKVFAGMQTFGEKAAGLGTAADPSSIIGKLFSGLGFLAIGMKDVRVLFGGGNLSTGAETEGFSNIGIKADTSQQIDSATTQLNLVSDSLNIMNNQMNLKLTPAMGNLDTNLSNFSKTVSSGMLFSNIQALGMFMGSPDSENPGMSLVEMLGTPADLTSTTDAITKWTGQVSKMFDVLGESLKNMDEKLGSVEALKSKIQSISELRQQLDNAMQSLQTEQKITVPYSPSGTGVTAAQPTPSRITSGGTQITLKFDIVMDSKSLEKTLVTRSDSIVVKALTGLAEGTNKTVVAYPGNEIAVATSKSGNP